MSLPRVHAAPADFAFGREAFAVVFGDVAGFAKGLRRSSWCCLRDPFPSRSRRSAESMRTMPYGRTPRSRSFWPMRQALRTCVRNFLRSSSSPIAEPPPVGGQTGATTEPTTKFLAPILSASFFRSSSLESMLTCGSKRKRSTPSNLTPLTSAAAVRSSMVSRSMDGSAPAPCRRGRATWRCAISGNCCSAPSPSSSLTSSFRAAHQAGCGNF